MEGHRFDRLSRGLAARMDRRRAIAGLLGLAAGAVGVGEATAADSRRTFCRALNTSCNRSTQCCSGFCDTRRSQHRTRVNKCACPDGITNCRGTCFDLANDDRNCGACGVRCPGELTCNDGVCDCGDLSVCGITCRDLEADTDNCGTCGTQCAVGASCEGGECVCPGPNDGICDNTCTDISTTEHCGPSCEPCGDGFDCVQGACTCGGATCGEGEKCCGGVCTKTEQNDSNCGACGNVCGADEICIASACQTKCVANSGPSPYLWCANLITGEAVNTNGYSFSNNPPCDSQSDCTAGFLCVAFLELPSGTEFNLRPGVCMYMAAEP